LDAYILTADVPGVDKKHIIVEVGPSKGDWKCGYIIITVKRKSHKKEKEEDEKGNGDDNKKMELESRYIRRERWSGRLCRKVALPEGVDKEEISARLKGGVLTVVMEKKEEAKAKRVDVKEEKDGGREEREKGGEGGEGPPLQWTLDDGEV
jgi:HSP20 family molecular chaperone IbpA